MDGDEIVIEMICLVRCIACNYLATVDDIREGVGCKQCGHRKFRNAIKITEEENKRLENLYKAGKLTLTYETPE
jgi:predicted  nucleic acid-binding Zn-ribbon protein